MFKWLTDLWHRINGWMHRRPVITRRVLPNTYIRSNLHGRHR
jgi:hypothetical protein